MALDKLVQLGDQIAARAEQAFVEFETYAQLGIVAVAVLFAYILAAQIRKYVPILDADTAGKNSHVLRRHAARLGNLLFPLIAILFLRVSVEISQSLLQRDWLVYGALVIATLFLFSAAVDSFVANPVAEKWLKWFGLPIVVMHYAGVLAPLIGVLESVAITIGNIQISAYGIIRVIVFGSLLFWLARIATRTGRSPRNCSRSRYFSSCSC